MTGTVSSTSISENKSSAIARAARGHTYANSPDIRVQCSNSLSMNSAYIRSPSRSGCSNSSSRPTLGPARSYSTAPWGSARPGSPPRTPGVGSLASRRTQSSFGSRQMCWLYRDGNSLEGRTETDRCRPKDFQRSGAPVTIFRADERAAIKNRTEVMISSLCPRPRLRRYRIGDGLGHAHR